MKYDEDTLVTRFCKVRCPIVTDSTLDAITTNQPKVIRTKLANWNYTKDYTLITPSVYNIIFNKIVLLIYGCVLRCTGL